jgi:hypothetical protein
VSNLRGERFVSVRRDRETRYPFVPQIRVIRPTRSRRRCDDSSGGHAAEPKGRAQRYAWHAGEAALGGPQTGYIKKLKCKHTQQSQAWARHRLVKVVFVVCCKAPQRSRQNMMEKVCQHHRNCLAGAPLTAF